MPWTIHIRTYQSPSVGVHWKQGMVPYGIIIFSAFIESSALIEADGVASAVGVDRFMGIDMDMDVVAACSIS